jgi:hypothetical protein
MKLISIILFLSLFLNSSQACKPGYEKIQKFFDNRKLAFNQAKKDAKIASTIHPYKVESVPMIENSKQVLDSDFKPVFTRQYYYKNDEGIDIVIQEHTFGHSEGSRDTGLLPHFNVRPITNTKTGKVDGTAGHYNIGSETE